MSIESQRRATARKLRTASRSQLPKAREIEVCGDPIRLKAKESDSLRIANAVKETILSHSVGVTTKRRKPRQEIWTLDCETDPFSLERNKRNEIPQPFIWGAYCHETQEYVELPDGCSVADFFADRGALVYAHNGGRFDYMYLRDHLNSDDPLLVISGRIAKCKIGNSEFRDSVNLLPVALDTFGGKTKIDYALMEPDRRADPNVMHEIKRYLKQDCATLAENLQAYFDQYGRSISQASASMKYWAKHFDNEIPRQSKSDFDRYKPFYYGGRVQCFADGVKSANFSVMDINSAYPYAMKQRHIFSTTGILRNHLPAANAIFRCLLKVRCSSRGAFPWRDSEGALYFPDDEGGRRKIQREYFVTGWEFLTALATDNISHIDLKEIHYFPETISFGDYIDHFYEKRMEAKRNKDKANDVFCKLFMNSLYGKFGQDCDSHRDFVIATTDSVADWKAKGYRDYKPWGSRFLMVADKKELDEFSPRRRYYNVATAASITGFVRAHLYRAANSCAGLIYCDTDSIAARDVSSLESGDALGQWKKEMDCDQYAIAGKKLYAMRDVKRDWEKEEAEKKGIFSGPDGWYKTACKGVDLTPEQIIKVAQGETIEYMPEVPTYSITRDTPRYINRNVMRTYKDISQVN